EPCSCPSLAELGSVAPFARTSRSQLCTLPVCSSFFIGQELGHTEMDCGPRAIRILSWMGSPEEGIRVEAAARGGTQRAALYHSAGERCCAIPCHRFSPLAIARQPRATFLTAARGFVSFQIGSVRFAMERFLVLFPDAAPRPHTVTRRS